MNNSKLKMQALLIPFIFVLLLFSCKKSEISVPDDALLNINVSGLEYESEVDLSATKSIGNNSVFQSQYTDDNLYIVSELKTTNASGNMLSNIKTTKNKI